VAPPPAVTAPLPRRSLAPPDVGDRLRAAQVETVGRHRAGILATLGPCERVELTRCAIRRGLVEP
jgi:hypothetical protein